MSRFIAADRQTDYLFPPSVEDWLPEDHMARFVVEVIEQLDLSELTRQYAGRGSAAHYPAVLLGLLVYGYATGVASSRKIERATYDSAAFRYIAANTHPDHDTLASFRRRFGPQLDGYFSAANVAACEQAGVVPLIARRREQHHLPIMARFIEPPPLAEGTDAVASMVHRLQTRRGRALYALRKQTVEPVFGIIKHVMKFRQFMLRGVQHVGHEWNLVSLTWNLKRMNALKMA